MKTNKCPSTLATDFGKHGCANLLIFNTPPVAINLLKYLKPALDAKRQCLWAYYNPTSQQLLISIFQVEKGCLICFQIFIATLSKHKL